ncbi:MAG: ATP-binding protein [Gammaproteobacteria bacterium]|nr:ATP-binding protein [Gammaproteobacteria bacterium]
MADNKELSNIYNFMHDGISTVVSVSNDLLSLNKDNSVDDALDLLTEKLKMLNYFDAFAFYKVKDLIDFNQSFCYPETEKNIIEQDVEEHINKGTFSWALNNTRPVVVSGPVSGYNQVLFSLSTKRRIHGMFIANAKNKGEVSGVSLEILQLILSITVFSIDNLQLTEQLTDYAHNLEDKVSERTKELEAAKIHAEQLSKGRSEFLANMSHEIRTPMNGVLGMMELLEETNLNKKQRHYVNTAKSSGNNMMVILNDILDLSKVESGKLVIEEEEFNLIESISDLSAIFAMELQAKGVDLIVSVDPALPRYLLGGQTRFWQVIMNLLGNAKKFTAHGEIVLTLTLNNIINDEVDIFVSVKDSGVGIAEKSLGKVFESFEQAEVNTSRHFGGTGLGLTLCKKLTNMMGGDINVKSILGEGSEFYFNVKMKQIVDAPETYSFEKEYVFNAVYLSNDNKSLSAVSSVFESLKLKNSLHDSKSDIDKVILALSNKNTNIFLIDEKILQEKNWSAKDIEREYAGDLVEVAVVCNEQNKDKYSDFVGVITKPFLENKLFSYLQTITGEIDTISTSKKEKTKINANVLVVEDNDVNQMVVAGMLNNLGCKYTVAENGQIGLDYLATNKFDIVLMDINMPVLNGRNATIQYRENEPEDEHLPIVALTADVLTENVATYYEAGMDDYMPKPFSSGKLREVLLKWVKQSGVVSGPHHVDTLLIDEAGNFDTEKIDSLKDMMGDAFGGLVETYINRSLELKNNIMKNKDDVGKLIQDIHSLKGSSGTMGAKKLFSICEGFESKLKKGEYESNDSEVNKIMNELNAVHDYLTC